MKDTQDIGGVVVSVTREMQLINEKLEALRSSLQYHMEEGVVYNLSKIDSSLGQIKSATRKTSGRLGEVQKTLTPLRDLTSSQKRLQAILLVVAVVQAILLAAIAFRIG